MEEFGFSGFSPLYSSLIDRLIDLSIDEDIGPGDITTRALKLADRMGRARIIAKEPLVVAGMWICSRVFHKIDPAIEFDGKVSEGESINDIPVVMAEVQGRMSSLLCAERIALNFCQRMCGIATHVKKIITESGVEPGLIVDTRKTVPGWRILEKYAVAVAGARNHRMGLYDGVLIKDNHILAAGGIRKAVQAARKNVSHLVKIEVETENLSQVEEALEAGADVILLDNMDYGMIRDAVRIIGKRAAIEVSGNVEPASLRKLAGIGIDFVSMGALTHQAVFVDISMDFY